MTIGPVQNLYFPQLFRSLRPYYRAGIKDRLLEATNRGGISASNSLLMSAICDAAMDRGVPKDKLLDGNFLALETIAAQSFMQLDLDGTPLYDIDPALLEALSLSDPGDMELADIRTVNRAYYLHWGPQPELLLHGAHPVEGALVMTAGDDWRIGLAARTGAPWLGSRERDTFFLRFPADTLARPFEEAVDLALQRDKDELLAIFSDPKTLGQHAGVMQIILDDLDRNAEVVKRALMLCGNCMSYLAAYPDDSASGWQPDTPASMLAKVAKGGKEGARTASKLESMGYLQVHRVGLDFHRLAERGAHEQAVGTHGGPRPHWRRGHWRHQAHGPQMSLRKLLWIQPSRVVGTGS